MGTRLITAVLTASMVFSSTAAFAHENTDKLGKGEYFIHVFPGLRLSDPANRMTQVDFDVLQRFDTKCREDAKFQNPSWVKTVVYTAIRNAPGAFVGGMLGAKFGGFIYKGGPGMLDYGIYNGVATVGGSLGSGITAHEMGKHASIAGCMMGMLNIAQRMGALRHVIITYNSFPVNGHAIKRSNLPAPTPAEMERAGQLPQGMPPASSQEPASHDGNNDGLLPPPPQ